MSINTSLSDPRTSVWDHLHWHPSAKQFDQFSKLQILIKFWNNQVNLTRLIDENDYWVTHIFDSLWPFQNELKSPNNFLNCVDVGSGCGFPGLAVAIALPKAKVTLIESIGRKTTILKKFVNEIGLSSRTIICNERVEVMAHKPNFRVSYDIAMARAVADAPIVSEYLIPLLKPEGEALIYRGKWNESDQKRLNIALEKLNARTKIIQHMELPEGKGERNIIRIYPIKACSNKYPRAIGIPIKKPLAN